MVKKVKKIDNFSSLIENKKSVSTQLKKVLNTAI